MQDERTEQVKPNTIRQNATYEYRLFVRVMSVCYFELSF
jgi:hypothetical protein